MIGIYKITNKSNDKVYIGQSIDILQRWSKHKRIAFNSNSVEYEYPLYRAIRKYGIDSFTFEIIEECNKIDLNNKEEFWINYYNSFLTGYNQAFKNNAPVEAHDIAIGVISDLKNSKLSCIDIANKWNYNIRMVYHINNGTHWKQENYSYPIRDISKKQIEKPSREVLKQGIRTIPFLELGRKYNVSDNAIRKWCIKYNLPKTKKEINTYSNEEWLKI